MESSDPKTRARAERRKAKRKAKKQQARKEVNHKGKVVKTVHQYLPSQANRKSGGRQKNRGSMYPTTDGLIALTKPQAIAMCLSLPEEGVLERFASTFESDATAVAVPMSNPKIDFNTGTTPTTDMPAGETFVVAQRVLECGSISYMANTTGTGFTYQLLGSTPADEFVLPYPTSSWTFPAIENTVNNLHVVCGVAINTFAPHGQTWFAACDTATESGPGSDLRIFWLDAGSSVQMVSHITTAVAAVDLDFTINQWTEFGLNKNAQEVSVVTDASGVFALMTLSVQKSGYYWFAVELNGSYDFVIDNLQYDHEFGIFAHQCIPGFDVNGGRFKAGHVSAVSTQFVNTAPLIENSGNVALYQTKPEETWMSFVGNYSKVANSKGSYSGAASKGSYGFLRPDSVQNFIPKTYSLWYGGSLLDSWWPLRQGCGSLLTYIQISDATGRQGFYKLRYGVEYLTSDVWSEVEMPTANPKDWDNAIQALKKIPQFHENPLHLGEIWSKIKSGLSKAANFAMQKGPAVLKGIETIMPLLGL